jgi:hypothetical protein
MLTQIDHLVLGSITSMKFHLMQRAGNASSSGACLCPDLTDSLTSTREPLCLFREPTPAENRTTTMLVSCTMQAEPRDCRSVLGDGHHHRMLLLSVTLHWHNIGDPEIQGHQIPPVFGDLRGE